MTAEQFKTYCELEKKCANEVSSFFTLKGKADVHWSSCMVDTENCQVTYGISFMHKDGCVYHESLVSDKFMNHDIVYETLKAEYMTNYARKKVATQAEQREYLIAQLEDIQAQLGRLDV